MACSILTQAHFTLEQSLSFPLRCMYSVWKLGWMNKLYTMPVAVVLRKGVSRKIAPSATLCLESSTAKLQL